MGMKKKQPKRSKTQINKVLSEGIPKHGTDPSPAITAFHTLIQYCIKHNPKDADIQFDPVTEDELKIVEDRLGYTLQDDLRSIYLIHRNALCDHSLFETELIPRFSTLCNPHIRGNCEYKEITPNVIHFADHFEQNTWKLYHMQHGCIMEYCEEPDMDYPPCILWFSVTHLLLSYVHMIKTFAPYWWDNKKYNIKDLEKYHQWEDQQRKMICQTDNGKDYDNNMILHMDGYDDEDEISWKSVIDEYLQDQIIRQKDKRMNEKYYLVSSEADKWAQQHRVYDASWDSKNGHRHEFWEAKRESINYTE